MTIWYRIRGFVRWLFRRNEVEQALERDIADYIERAAAEKMRAGMSEFEARRAARIELGGVEQTKVRVRERLSYAPLEALARDARYAFRTMGRQKAFTALVVLCLALGIGANTSVYSLMESILLRPLPVDAPDELVYLQWTARPPGEGVPFGMNVRGGMLTPVDSRVRSRSWPYPVFELFREQRDLLTDLFGTMPAPDVEVGGAEGPLVDGLYVTGNFFSTLGVDARAGRVLTVDDDRFEAPPAVMLSSSFAAERFGSAESAVGQSIRLGGVAFTVVGVTPPSFYGLDPARSQTFYLPMRAGQLNVVNAGGYATVGSTPEMYGSPSDYWISAWARLRPGVTSERVEATLRPQFERFFADNVTAPGAERNVPRLEAANGAGGLDGLRMQYGDTLIVLFAMVVLILAVACASIASLLLGRAAVRRREMAVRISVGAGRRGVIGQLLTESVLLALLGGAAGVLLSLFGVRVLAALLAGVDSVPFRVEPNWSVAAFALGVTLLTGVLFGLAPALHATKVDVFDALKGSRSMPDAETPRSRSPVGFGSALVAAQIALALVLLVGAGLFSATLANLRTTELGFNPDRLLLADVDTSRTGLDGDSLKAFYGSVRERLAALPGVENASLSWSVLAGGGTYLRQVTVPGTSVRDAGINVQVVGASFFETMQIEILSGRPIRDHEVESAQAVAVVDRSFVETFFPGTDPIGRTIEVQGEGELRIVGVSTNARHDVIKGDVRPVVYYTYTWDPHPLFNMVVELRTRGEPLDHAETLRTMVRGMNPQVAVNRVRTQAANTDSTINREILFARLSNAFALLTLVIACVGLYGTVSFRMARRTAEIGIRMALGATRSRMLRFALWQALSLGLAGLVVGLPAALIASRFIESFLWDVAPYDPVVLTGAALAVLVSVTLAGYVPASRASNIEPMSALRSE